MQLLAVLILQLLKDSVPAGRTDYTRTAAFGKGARGEIPTGAHLLEEMAASGELLSPAISAPDCAEYKQTMATHVRGTVWVFARVCACA